MKLVIKGPFTALRVNRALVGLPRYLPSSRMWFEKIEFKGVRWSLKWPACWSQVQEEPARRRWGWGRGAAQGEGLGGGATREGRSERVPATSAEGPVPAPPLPSAVSGPGLAIPRFGPQLSGAGREQGEAAGPFSPSAP